MGVRWHAPLGKYLKFGSRKWHFLHFEGTFKQSLEVSNHILAISRWFGPTKKRRFSSREGTSLYFNLLVKVRETSETWRVMIIRVKPELITKLASYCISAISSVFTPLTAILMDW